MKKSFFFAMLMSAVPAIAFAQAPPATNSPRATNAPPSETVLRDQLPIIVDSSMLGARAGGEVTRPAHARVDGALVRATRAGQPWQAINPFAPAEFGQWYDNVSVNPHTHAPEGVVLVSIHFGGIGHARP